VTEVAFLEPGRLFFLWAALPLFVLFVRAHRRTREAARSFAGPSMAPRILPPLRGRDVALRGGVFVAGLALGVLAWSRPSWDFETVTSRAEGLDIVVVVDVSRSMLADDGGETRLDRARAAVRWLARNLRHHRLGLVAFAGEALRACPLTLDHAHFLDVLDRLQPGMVGRGGTRIGVALRAAGELLDAGAGRDRVVLLLSDAGDQDSYPLDAARELARTGVRVVAVGVGRTRDPQEPLVIDGQVIRDAGGRPVLARVNGELLGQLALETSGLYVPPESLARLVELFDRYIAPLAVGGHGEYQERHPRERFTVFLLPAVLLLLAQAGLGLYPRPRKAGA
jgi:Ca-activated chloride channel family protein